MQELNDEQAERAQLEELASDLRKMAPRSEPPQPPPTLLPTIEERSRTSSHTITLHRRWMTASMVACATAFAIGLFVQREPDIIASGLSVANSSAVSTPFDLGTNVGRVLARPNCSFRYHTDARTIDLHHGTLVAHIRPGAGAFEVRTGSLRVRVLGTLFSVNADTQEVVVWEGRVETTQKGQSQTRVGSGKYHELTMEELAALDFVVPPQPQPLEHVEEPQPTAAPKHSPQPKNQQPEEEPPEDESRKLVLRAQAALVGGDFQRARALLREHQVRFSDSPLTEEADLMLLRALKELAQWADLISEAESFLQKHPDSSRVGDVRALIELAKKDANE